LTNFGEPEIYYEAMQIETKKKWEQAMEEEMDSLVNLQGFIYDFYLLEDAHYTLIYFS